MPPVTSSAIAPRSISVSSLTKGRTSYTLLNSMSIDRPRPRHRTRSPRHGPEQAGVRRCHTLRRCLRAGMAGRRDRRSLGWPDAHVARRISSGGSASERDRHRLRRLVSDCEPRRRRRDLATGSFGPAQPRLDRSRRGSAPAGEFRHDRRTGSNLDFGQHATGPAPAGLACGCRRRVRRRSSTQPERASSRTACATPTKFDRIQPGSGCMSWKRLDDGCGAFPFEPQATLGAAETVFSMGDGFFPDGFAFDEEGGLWVTSLVSNRLVRLHHDRIGDRSRGCESRLRRSGRAGIRIAHDGGGTPRPDSRDAAAATHQRGIWRAGSADRLSGFAPRLLLVPLSHDCQRRNPAALVTSA